MVRSPMQVDDEFRKKIKELQEKIMKKDGKFTSIPKITEKMAKSPEWKELEQRIINGENLNLNLNINLDARKGKW